MPAGFRRKRAREQQQVRVDGNGVMRGVIGDAGLTDEDVVRLGSQLDEAAAALDRHRRTGGAVPSAKTDLRRTVRLAEQVRGAFEDLVVLGTGGLALGVRALVSALTPPAPVVGTPASGAVRVHVVDRLDPERIAALLARLDLRGTAFNVVSGPGDAIETTSLFLIARDRLLKELGAVAYKHHVVITTHLDGGPLRQIVNDEGFRDLTLPADIEDAVALLTAGALFPAACAGSDISELMVGAADMDARCRSTDAATNPARLLASGLLHAGGQDRRPRVATPSMRSLGPLAEWIERPAGGVDVDDASPLGAPRLVLFLRVERRSLEIEVPRAYQDVDGVGYLGGADLGTLADRQVEAAEMALWSAGRPTMTVVCPEITPYVLGQLVHLTTTATALARAVDGLPVRPAADPGRLAYGLAGRPGYEAERAEAQRWAARREARHVV